jgi:glutamate decarboxylase
VRHGVSRDLAALLLADIQAALEYLKNHPAQSPLESHEASGFHH